MDDETQRRHRIETAIVIARAYERLLEKPAERVELHSDRSGTRFDHADVISEQDELIVRVEDPTTGGYPEFENAWRSLSEAQAQRPPLVTIGLDGRVRYVSRPRNNEDADDPPT